MRISEINIDRMIGIIAMVVGFIFEHPYLFAFGAVLYLAGASKVEFH